ncbi:transglutaminase domain-containing protein [Labilibacter marinus]|uniref:transglutaminase domain-containing protein n=1 Tax=Labilibacter marinus TaxID=1477105 RepID=UPI0009503488|nr:transglutaminase domain-containing protein [Labilibacter marinus]
MSLFILLCCAIADNTPYSKQELKKKWPKAETIISNYTTVITFAINSNSGKIEVFQNDTIDIVPILNKPFERLYYYNNYASVNKCTLKENNEYKKRMSIIDGNEDSENIFHSDLKFRHFSYSPDINSKFYRFTGMQTINDIRYWGAEFLNDPIYPVKTRKYIIKIPKWLKLKIQDFNFKHFDISKTEKNGSDGSTLIEYTAKNLNKNPSKKNKDSFLSPFHSYPNLLFLPEKYTNENGNDKNIHSNVDDLYKWYTELAGNLDYDTVFFEPIVTDIVTEAKSSTDSIKAIYYWVQDNIRYVAFEEGLAGFRPDRAKSVYEKKYGDCKGMSNLLSAMLNQAGFNAKIAWMGTQHLIYDYSTPSIATDNHMICYLNHNNQDYYLDATYNKLALGNNSPAIQGKQVLIENGSNYIIKTIPKKDVKCNIAKQTSNYTIHNNQLIGNTTLSYSGDAKIVLNSALTSIKQNDKEKFIQEVVWKHKDIQISDIEITNINQRDSALIVNFQEKNTNCLVKFDQEVFLNVNKFNSTTAARVDTVDRYHIYLTRKINSQSEMSIELPSTMQLIKLPKSESYSDSIFSFKVDYMQVDNKIIFSKELKIDHQIIYKDLFNKYYTFLDKYKKCLNKTIELTIKQP